MTKIDFAKNVQVFMKRKSFFFFQRFAHFSSKTAILYFILFKIAKKKTYNLSQPLKADKKQAIRVSQSVEFFFSPFSSLFVPPERIRND
jgi:hypothetical protein